MGDVLPFPAPPEDDPPRTENLECGCGGQWWQTAPEGGALVLSTTAQGVRVTGMHQDLVCASCGERITADQVWGL